MSQGTNLHTGTDLIAERSPARRRRRLVTIVTAAAVAAGGAVAVADPEPAGQQVTITVEALPARTVTVTGEPAFIVTSGESLGTVSESDRTATAQIEFRNDTGDAAKIQLERAVGSLGDLGIQMSGPLAIQALSTVGADSAQVPFNTVAWEGAEIDPKKLIGGGGGIPARVEVTSPQTFTYTLFGTAPTVTETETLLASFTFVIVDN
jgi:hypothetical protein